ncbi:tartrate dehydrogenase [Blastomyces dermatitidis ER-3]|uniref:Tartrate dehydrogenase n=1 Tax=Ajellomyces dermatitidis (strain ER-3 / ATCC MYA-2586) TaxID=559297 RepID=A0ABP2F7X4_AJEDR|nr:tartrate dehydrogenase [Blastomyces dermatitidis ER-3]EEQ92570.2 tartrate dehydrogenase [Blastomyces dermatitidis ER-3]
MPTRVFHGIQSPLHLDWVIVRENSEGEYAGHGGRSYAGKPWEVATDISIFTRHGVERIMKFAFEAARSRAKKHITVATKSNAQRNGLVVWDEIAAAEVAAQFPDVTCDKMLVDAMTARVVLTPESLDTIVPTNLVCRFTFPFLLSGKRWTRRVPSWVRGFSLFDVKFDMPNPLPPTPP